MSGRRRAAVAAALVAALGAAASASAGPPPESDGRAVVGSERSLLFLALDAVPYSIAAEAHGGDGLFDGFHPPVPLISTYPSSTSVAFGAILEGFGLEPSPGYEARFFDWDEGRVVGGGPLSYFRIRFPWREFFDWNRKGALRNFLQSARPVRSSLRELAGALEEFAAGRDRAYFAYVAATDTAAHLQGPESLLPVLEELDGLLRRARSRRAVPFDTVLFSDHGIAGGENLVNVRDGVGAALAAAGLRVRERLERPGDVVLTPFGLVSSFEIYAAETDGERAARAAARAPGVDLCAHRDGGGWVVVAGDRRARFSRHSAVDGTAWLYEPLEGDPLGLAATRAFREAGGALADRRALDASLDGPYPDALHRIARAFELVENPATAICSVESGRMYGAGRTEWLARVAKGPLRWTHGALGREASLGFVMTDREGWRPSGALRAGEALVRFGDGPAAHPALLESED